MHVNKYREMLGGAFRDGGRAVGKESLEALLRRPSGTLNPESRATSVRVLSQWEGSPRSPTHQCSIHTWRLWHNFSLTSGPGHLGYLPQNRHGDYNVQPVSAFLLFHEDCIPQMQVTCVQRCFCSMCGDSDLPAWYRGKPGLLGTPVI